VPISGFDSSARVVPFSPSDILKRKERPARHPTSDRTDLPLSPAALPALDGPARDGVEGVRAAADDQPADPPHIVSVSDIHGYLEAGRNALLTLADHHDMPPVVTADGDGRLHWAGENYILLFNGDLVDRGPANAETVELAARLLEEAPPGRVRVTLGNHEMAILTPDLFGWDGVYSTALDHEDRRAFVAAIQDGLVVAAYEGYNLTYAHAGHPEPYEAAAVNDELVAAVDRLEATIGDEGDATAQSELVEEYPRVLGIGGVGGRGPGAGLAWLDFRHMPPDAPPQVVGHSRHDQLTRKGTVLCQNVIRNNLDRMGGEAVTVETPDRLIGLTRDADGEVSQESFDLAPPEPD
jgi:hypothetical protein